MYSQNKQSFGYLLRKVCEGILYSNHLLMAHCEANPEEDSGVATLASGHGMSWGGGDEGHGFADVVLDFRQEISMMAK